MGEVPVCAHVLPVVLGGTVHPVRHRAHACSVGGANPGCFGLDLVVCQSGGFCPVLSCGLMEISLCSKDSKILMELKQSAPGLGGSFHGLFCLSLKALHLGKQSVPFFSGLGLFRLLAFLQKLNSGLQITPLSSQSTVRFL